MAKKEKRTELKRPLTKRQLSKWRRQQRIQRIAILAGSLFFVFILGYIGYGYYDEEVRPLKQPVLRVNDTVFDMAYYLSMLELYTRGQESSVVPHMADAVVNAIEHGKLIRDRASDLGVMVSSDEIQSELSNLKLPKKKVYTDFIATNILAAKLLRDYFDPEVPTACEQVKVKAMFLESKTIARDIVNRLKDGDDFSTLAQHSSREEVTRQRSGDLGWLPKGFAGKLLGLESPLLEKIAFSVEPGMLSEPIYDDSVPKNIGYWILGVTEKDDKKGRHVRGILLGSWDEAMEIRAKLESGEDFAALAREYSQHAGSKEQGGDLGWTQEIFSRVLVRFASQLEPGQISNPISDESVKTQGGYWLVKVEDKDVNRQLDDETRQKLKIELLMDWVRGLKEKSTIENYLTAERKSWAVAYILKNRRQ